MHTALISFFLLPAFLLADSPDALVGRWKSTDVSGAGVRAIFVFGKDKVLDTYSAVILEGTYRLVGTDTIILQTKGSREQKLELEWDNDSRARIEDEAAGKVIEITRAGKRVNSGNALVGEWEGTHEWNGKVYPARALFFADGRNIWIVNLRVETGRYNTKGQTLRFEIDGRQPIEGSFSVTGDRLSLPNPRGGQSSFERMDLDFSSSLHRE